MVQSTTAVVTAIVAPRADHRPEEPSSASATSTAVPR